MTEPTKEEALEAIRRLDDEAESEIAACFGQPEVEDDPDFEIIRRYIEAQPERGLYYPDAREREAINNALKRSLTYVDEPEPVEDEALRAFDRVLGHWIYDDDPKELEDEWQRDRDIIRHALQSRRVPDLDDMDRVAVSGMKWIARQSVTGRGFRLHQDPDGEYDTARDALTAYLEAAPEGGE